MADPLRKCISMGGAGTLRFEGHPNDLRAWGNREYLGESSTSWVKLWVSWLDLQPERPPGSRAESWQELNSAPGGAAYLRRLDAQVRAANDDGLGVILGLYHAYPTWATGATGRDPFSTRLATQRIPIDLSPGGPWGWFVEHLCARYAGGVRNLVGPQEVGETTAIEPDAGVGNPDGARIDALELLNESNTLAWPQEDLPARAAEMVRSADALAAPYGGPTILAPGTLDYPAPDARHDPRKQTDWLTFTERMLDALQGFAPRVPTGWSIHNYRDAKDEIAREQSRVRAVLELLRAGGFGGGDPQLWITESGLNMYPAQATAEGLERQRRVIERNFLEMRDEPGVVLWTQHVINDITGNTFKSGLRDDFVYGPEPGPGAPRPAWHLWRELPGAPRPHG